MNGMLRVLVHAQHLSGTGHFVRAFEIARAISARHRVWLTDGGRVVPRPVGDGASFDRIELPRLFRDHGVLRGVDSEADPAVILAERASRLVDAAESIRPDVLIVEHFPFSKWELEPEIVPLIERVRRVHPGARVLCSVRDIVTRSRFDGDPEVHAARVLGVLHRLFDGVLVHADPAVTRLGDHLPWARDLALPVHHTGFVAPRLEHGFRDPSMPPRRVIVSTGGAGDGSLAATAIEAWMALRGAPCVPDAELVVFLPPFAADARRRTLEPLVRTARAHERRVSLRDFTASFLHWLLGADLSVSHAGYNTCTNLLETRVRAVVVPDPTMPDQILRGALFARRGLVRCIDAAACSAERLAESMRAALEGPPPTHDIDLNGAERTVEILEAWPARA